MSEGTSDGGFSFVRSRQSDAFGCERGISERRGPDKTGDVASGSGEPLDRRVDDAREEMRRTHAIALQVIAKAIEAA